MNTSQERPVLFECDGERLLGILHQAVLDSRSRAVGVLIVVGGPQYRVGSHRQFVRMARDLASEGFPVFRFDCRGMGDSSGTFPGFDSIESDIRAACDAFTAEMPVLQGLIIFGLCDAASAALIYARSDPRVCGMILANPWVRTDSGGARALVRHYYWRRLLQASFWRKLLLGQLRMASSLIDLVRNWRRAFGIAGSSTRSATPYLERMLEGLQEFDGRVLLILSENDLTAHEFRDLCETSATWGAAIARSSVTSVHCEGADHTFASEQAHHKGVSSMIAWLRQWGGK